MRGKKPFPDQIQWTESKFTQKTLKGISGGIIFWAGISHGGHTNLYVFHGGTLTGPHRAEFVGYLEGHGLERIDLHRSKSYRNSLRLSWQIGAALIPPPKS
ncbi:hypothetical protein TNCV_4883961 [Trichonephila clavipes]|nr:hypothetical protein TNCV_4883961 [Trichonephila clavipes]